MNQPHRLRPDPGQGAIGGLVRSSMRANAVSVTAGGRSTSKGLIAAPERLPGIPMPGLQGRDPHLGHLAHAPLPVS